MSNENDNENENGYKTTKTTKQQNNIKMVGGVANIRYANAANLSSTSKASMHYYAKEVTVTGSYTDICIGRGAYTLVRSIENGVPVYDVTISFITPTKPAFCSAKSFIIQDRQGRNWLLGWDDEDDYPQVTWQEENEKSGYVGYQVTVTMKSRIGMMRVL